MGTNRNNELKTLTEIVTGLSEKIDNSTPPEIRTNFFEDKKTVEQEKEIIAATHKINSLETEFYAPDTAETVFSNDVLLEQKIIKLKKEIEIIDNKINAEKTFENSDVIQNLVLKRAEKKNELIYAIKEYKNIPYAVKIKNKILYTLKFLIKCMQRFNIFANSTDTELVSNQPVWKKNLQKLNSINREIDEIIKTNIPFGEQEEKYEKLSKSLNQALKLRNSINKDL